jgi:hypothetical protein
MRADPMWGGPWLGEKAGRIPSGLFKRVQQFSEPDDTSGVNETAQLAPADDAAGAG